MEKQLFPDSFTMTSDYFLDDVNKVYYSWRLFSREPCFIGLEKTAYFVYAFTASDYPDSHHLD